MNAVDDLTGLREPDGEAVREIGRDGLISSTGLRVIQPGEGGGVGGFCYRPSGGGAAGTLVAVHGVTRRVQEQLDTWRPVADALGLGLVTPHFDRQAFHGYQRLARNPGKEPADVSFVRLLDRLRRDGWIGDGPLFLFGFSGGAQFVHRWAMTHPNSWAALVVAAAGYYTFPDRMTPYPYGLAVRRASRALHVEAIVRKPVLVVVGEHDTERDRHLRRRMWLDAWQGRTRLERAQRWVEALHRVGRRCGLEPDVSLAQVAGAGHSFSACAESGLTRIVQGFLSRLAEPIGGRRRVRP